MTYQTINTIVMQSDAELSAAQAHGMATGMLCVNGQAQSAEWLTELFRHATPPAGQNKTALEHLFEETRNLLASDEFEFDLLLPDDDDCMAATAPGSLTAFPPSTEARPGGTTPRMGEVESRLEQHSRATHGAVAGALLSERIEALTEWCRGFLFGVGFTHASSAWSRDATEILKDIVEFTKLDAEAEGEEDESDFMEITEYMRSAVLLLRSELNSEGEKGTNLFNLEP